MASDGQYALPGFLCTIKNDELCHIQGQCRGCVRAWVYEHPDEVLNVSRVGE